MNHFTDFLSPVAKNAPASHSDKTTLTLSTQGGIMKRFATVLSSLSPSAGPVFRDLPPLKDSPPAKVRRGGRRAGAEERDSKSGTAKSVSTESRRDLDEVGGGQAQQEK